MTFLRDSKDRFVCGKLLVVQNRITAFWFRDKELAMAFGFTLAFSRLGSVLNFLLTARFDEKFGLQWTLWAGKSNIVYLLISVSFVEVTNKTLSVCLFM